MLECERSNQGAVWGGGALGLESGKAVPWSPGWPESRKGFSQVYAEVRFALSGDFQPPWVFSIFSHPSPLCSKKESETHMSN